MLTVIQGDCRERLRELADESVHCVISSPPYWGLRDYGVGGQLGLESSPEEYVAQMVAVFREVRRVLRSDGTCWVNLGDAYAHGTPGGGSVFDNGRNDGRIFYEGDKVRGREKLKTLGPGLKPKDLCGIPWMLAKALQAPYYTGRIQRIEDRVWLAAMIDAEGCMFIHKRKAGQNNGQGYERKNDNYGPGLEVSNTHRSIVERCLEIVGLGSICTVERESRMKNRNIPLHRWNLRTTQCRDVIREVYPYLVGKQHEARLLLGCPSSGKDAELAHAGLMALHNGYTPEIDFPAPASMFEQGWWLRSEIIWSKNNPMPESVTDRPTKAHEQVFLLAKSARYFYDAEAIRESAEYGRREWTGRLISGGENGDGHRSSIGTTKGSDSSAGRNRRTVWTIATQSFPESHFATFPEKLVEPMILAGTSARGCCAACGAPWERVVAVSYTDAGNGNNNMARKGSDYEPSMSARPYEVRKLKDTETTGWQPTCTCDCPDVQPCVVLDPFAGSGTVGQVALELGRRAVLIELNAKYCEMIERRNRVTYGLPGLA